MPSKKPQRFKRIITCVASRHLEFLNRQSKIIGVSRNETLRRIIDADMNRGEGK
jgi:hypothetical protein